MNRTDLDQLAKRLRLLARLAPTIAAQLDDLHSIAYDRKVGTSERIRRSRQTWHLDEIGEPEARALLDHLARQTDTATVGIVAALADLDRRLTGGPDADHSKRGSVLSRAEHGRLVKAQQRRRQRGEYTPVRNATQPKPGNG